MFLEIYEGFYMEHSKVVQMLTIATDFNNFVDDNELNLPFLNMSTVDDCIDRLKSFPGAKILQLWANKIYEYKLMGLSFND